MHPLLVWHSLSNATHASSGVIIFIRQGLSFSELSTSSLSSLDPYSDYVGVNISLNNSSSLLFLNVYAPLFTLPRRMAEQTPFLVPFFPPPEISLFWGTSIAITSSGTQEALPTLMGRKYLTGSSPLTSSPSMTLTYPPLSITPLAVALPLTFPLLPPLALSCFLKVLQDLDSGHLPIFVFVPLSLVICFNKCPPSFNFQKARWGNFVSYFDSHCHSAEEYSSFSLSSAVAFFTSLALNAAKFSVLSAASNAILKSFGLLRQKVWLVKDARLLLSLTEVMKITRLTSPLLGRASSVIAKAEAWQTTCSSLSPKSNLKTVYSLCTLYCWLFHCLPPLLTSQLFFSQEIDFGLHRLPKISIFCFSAKDPV